MQVPDGLSRKPHPEGEQPSLKVKDLEQENTHMVIRVTTKDGAKHKVLLNLKTQKKAHQEEIPKVFDYTSDPDYGELYQTLDQLGNGQLKPSESRYDIREGNLVWMDSRLTPRVCVPKKYRAAILHEFHDTPLGSHFGTDKTYAALRARYTWPHMYHGVDQYVLSCDACQKNKSSHQRRLGTPQLLDIPLTPWEHVSVDGCGPFPLTARGHDYTMNFICNLTREAILVPCSKTITAKETAKLYFKNVFPRTGLSQVIHSDRGPQFIAQFWTYLWKKLQTKVALSAPHHPKSNPYIERQNKTFQEALTSFCNARQDDWDECLIPYEFAYNTSVNPSLGETPFFLNHGRHPTLPVAIAHKLPSPAVEEYTQHLQNRIMEARDHLRRAQETRAKRLEQGMRPSKLKVGDLVLLSTEHYNLQLPSQKLAPKWLGPLKVLELRGPNTVRVEIPPRFARLTPLQNVENLKPYHPRPPEVGPSHEAPPPELVEGEEEFEVEDILAHRLVGPHKRPEFLVRFKGYGPEDDLWLPQRNLANAQDILKAYQARQTNDLSRPARPSRAQRAPRALRRMGHVFYHVSTARSADTGDCV